MASIAMTLHMMDGMSGPLARILNQLNPVVRGVERLNQAMSKGASNSLVPARAAGDQLVMIQNNQQIVHLTQVIQNNYKQINNTVNQNNLALQQTNNILEQTAEKQDELNDGVDQGAKRTFNFVGALKSAAAYARSMAPAVMAATDTYMNTQARIGLINDGLQTTSELQDKIFAAAERSRGSYVTMAGAIAKMGVAASGAFKSNDELIAFTELTQKSFRMGDASPKEQEASMKQLTEAMASGKLSTIGFRSLIGDAPMLAQAIADFTGKSIGELEKMTAEGAITADIIKGAIFAASDEINAKFEKVPNTFADFSTRAKDDILQGFGPVMERISAMLNSPAGEQFMVALQTGIAYAAMAADWLLAAIWNVYSFISGNWSTIEPIIWGLVAAMAAWYIATQRQVIKQALLAVWGGINTAMTYAQTVAVMGLAASWRALNAAQKANIFILLISLIVGLIVWLVKLWQTNDEFAAGLMRGWNAVMNFFNRVPIFFVRLGYGIMDFFHKMKIDSLKIYDQLINGIIDRINGLIGRLNKIKGVNIDPIQGMDFAAKAAIEAEAERLAKKAEGDAKIARMEADVAAKAAAAEQKVRDFENDRAAKRAKEEAEKEAKNGYEQNYDQYKTEQSPFDNATGVSNNINKVNEVGQINETVDISSEDLKIMRDLAEMNAIQNFVTLTPTVQVTTGPITKEADVNEVIRLIEGAMQTEIESSAKGAFA